MIESVISWLWKPAPSYRSQFNARHVNILASMVRRNYSKPHRFICVTDMPAGIDSSIEIVPLWKDFANVQNPFGPRNPSCYRRLKMFAREAEAMFGKRFVSLDLDSVILSDMSPIWDRDDDFIIWGDTSRSTPYNGSMMMMNAGARAQVWEKFDPAKSPTVTRKAGMFGSDQAWISHCLGPKEKKWTQADGVYSYRNEIAPNDGRLPKNAVICMFHGQVDPDSHLAQKHKWVRDNYC